ncbi:hypothetical protein FORC47_3123 [Bacillus cereus]|nr:hypothetical protein FORC47_3123 [Bacillus cereus]
MGSLVLNDEFAVVAVVEGKEYVEYKDKKVFLLCCFSKITDKIFIFTNLVHNDCWINWDTTFL